MGPHVEGPLLLLGQIFNYIDRTSVSFAALTMNGELGLTATQFGWGAGILFVGYCVGNIIGPQTFKSEEAPYYRSAYIA